MRGQVGIVTCVVACAAAGCGGGEQEAQAPIARETPADAIFRIGKVWESSVQERSFRSPPSRIALMTTRITSRLELSNNGTGRETLVYDDDIETADRAPFKCESRTELPVRLRFSELGGDPVVEVQRAAVQLSRQCDAPGIPEPTFDVPATTARFALRGDQLVPVAPPTEKRAYIPATQ